jgi:hypothetical protein
VRANLVSHLADLSRLHGWQDEARPIAEHVVHTFFSQLELGAVP